MIDLKDAHLADEIKNLGMKVHLTNIMMNTIEDKISLAKDMISLLEE